MGIFEISILLVAGLVTAIWGLTREQTIQADIENNLDKHHLQVFADLQSNNLALWLAVAGAALLTGGFAIVFFGAGSVDPREWSFTNAVFAIVGLTVTIGLTFTQKTLYSSINHNKSAFLVTLLLLSFLVVSEIATSSERTDEIVRNRSVNSEVFKAVTRNVGQMGVELSKVTPEQQALAKANASLNYWLDQRGDKNSQYQPEQIKRYIGNYQAEVDRLNTLVKMASANQKQVIHSLVEQAKGLEYNEKNQTVFVRWLNQIAATTSEMSSMFLALVLVIAFEAGFHFVGTRNGVLREVLQRKGYLVTGIVFLSLEKLPPEANKHASPTLSSMSPYQAKADTVANASIVGTQYNSETENQSLNSDSTVGTQSEQALQQAIYHAYTQALMQCSIGAAVRDARELVGRELKARGQHWIIANINQLADVMQDMACNDGLLKINPDYREGNRKPRYLMGV